MGWAELVGKTVRVQQRANSEASQSREVLRRKRRPSTRFACSGQAIKRIARLAQVPQRAKDTRLGMTIQQSGKREEKVMGVGFEIVIDRIMAVADEEDSWGKRKDRGRRPTSRKRGETWGTPAGKKKLPPKRVGEIAELAFCQKAIRMGFLVSKTWGDSDRYDFVADWEGKLYRVQVRSTEHLLGPRGYAVHASVYVGRKIVGLTKKDIDVLVAYIFPKDLWYVVPVEEFEPRKNLWFYPDGSKKGSMFEKFREAWGLMRGEGRKGKSRRE